MDSQKNKKNNNALSFAVGANVKRVGITLKRNACDIFTERREKML